MNLERFLRFQSAHLMTRAVASVDTPFQNGPKTTSFSQEKCKQKTHLSKTRKVFFTLQKKGLEEKVTKNTNPKKGHVTSSSEIIRRLKKK